VYIYLKWQFYKPRQTQELNDWEVPKICWIWPCQENYCSYHKLILWRDCYWRL